ncbi:hypothetical protein PHAGEALMA_171 [Escherichia phage vB_Eco_Alma]|nr:hypothetical protein PHAGEALMA_171 [Escherichia phage vB_Eco_Alma]
MTTVNITAGYNLSFDVLTDEQKEKAVEMVREREEHSGDNFFAESVIEYYKEYVFPEYGLEDTEVHWSGFWCQGDGASISAENVDLEKFLRKVKRPDQVPINSSLVRHNARWRVISQC